MKYSSLLLSILGLLAHTAPAHSAQVWAEGVTQTSGWIDYEKVYGSGDGDDKLCWAASASNIIDYWQQRYIVPEDIPTGEAIWTRFKEACHTENGGKDMGGNFLFAMQWWLGGDYGGTTVTDNIEGNQRAYYYDNSASTFPISTDLDIFDGYYWDDYIPTLYYFEDENQWYTSAEILHLRDFLWLNDPSASLSDQIVNHLQYGTPISLGIGNNLTGDDKLAHAITLWGVEYDEESGNISSLWITDSDDYNYLFGGDELREISTTVSNGTIYLTNYANNYGDIFITEALGINLSESDTWDLTRAIPEPATATLSLLALAGLAARRRRR